MAASARKQRGDDLMKTHLEDRRVQNVRLPSYCQQIGEPTRIARFRDLVSSNGAVNLRLRTFLYVRLRSHQHDEWRRRSVN